MARIYPDYNCEFFFQKESEPPCEGMDDGSWHRPRGLSAECGRLFGFKSKN